VSDVKCGYMESVFYPERLHKLSVENVCEERLIKIVIRIAAHYFSFLTWDFIHSLYFFFNLCCILRKVCYSFLYTINLSSLL
jgi:hypothetical protein